MTGSESPGRASGPPQKQLLRAGRAMALGTIASRATGFLRTSVLAAALGSKLVADAYNVANTTPNIIYELLLGGVLTSVVVPLLVDAARGSDDGGQAYAQRLLGLVTVALGLLTVLAVALAPQLVDLYGSWRTPEQRQLAETLARFFLPQILFYGVGALLGGILNSRGSFAAPMWAPVLNNVVVIATGVAFLAVVADPTPGSLPRGAVVLLGLGTTAGIVAQTIALLPSLRATGFRLRLRFDWRGTGLRRALPLAGWVLVYVAANQLAYLVVVRLATSAASATAATGYSPYTYAFLLLQLPHAVVAVSVITALLPRMSAHASDRRPDLVRADLSQGLRLTAVALVPASVALLALGQQLAVLVYGHGATSVADARQIGVVLGAFAVGLVPFSAYQLLLRAFYALQDTRTPAVLNLGTAAANVAVDLVLFAVLPAPLRVVGLALGLATSYVVGLALLATALRRRLGGLDGARITRTLVRLVLASVLAGVPSYLAARFIWAALGVGTTSAALGLVVAAALGATGYVLLARRMRVSELTVLLAAVRGRSEA